MTRAISKCFVFVAAVVASSCTKQAPDTANPDVSAPAQPEAATPVQEGGDAWTAVLSASHRSEENRARDVYRHPQETLAFFGVTPSSTVVELWPGRGWYTEVLGPYLKDSGQLIVTTSDPAGTDAYYGTKQAQEMIARFKAEAETLGDVKTVTVEQKIEIGDDGKVKDIKVTGLELAPEGTVDVVLTFRNSHGWYRRDAQNLVYGAAFKALKPGGVFGVVQHRAAQGADPNETAKNGYLPEATVIEAAEAVGFKLAEKSEVNANTKDTKDHPEGVWTLPPSLALKDKDRDKYLAIGESDRMTLKFVKPAS